MVSELPEFVRWLQAHQKEAGVFVAVSRLVDQYSDNPAARVAAQEIAGRLGGEVGVDAVGVRLKNRDRCAGSLLRPRPHASTLTPAPQAGGARPSLRHACSALFLLSNSLTWGQNGTEPQEAVPDRRAVVVAVRRPAEDRVVAPTAAPIHTVRA